jgi:hypothetical protein
MASVTASRNGLAGRCQITVLEPGVSESRTTRDERSIPSVQRKEAMGGGIAVADNVTAA